MCVVCLLIHSSEPDLDHIERRSGKVLEQFRDLVYPADYDPEAAAKAKPAAKRKVQTTWRCVLFHLNVTALHLVLLTSES